jgi:hypothetical protein
MVNEHYFKINSTEDISAALSKAEHEGIDLDYFNSIFLIIGERGRSISVDDSLRGLHVVATGPAPVWVSGEGEAVVIARESATIYATEGSSVRAHDEATVYAYDRAQVEVLNSASVYVASDDVDVEAYGYSTVYLPDPGEAGSTAEIYVEDDAKVIRGVSASMSWAN